VRTRVGLGIGLAYARKIPLMEVRDLPIAAAHSKLLNTFDPTVDVSVGDLLGARSLRDTYVGLGVATAPASSLVAPARQRQRRLQLHLRLRRDDLLALRRVAAVHRDRRAGNEVGTGTG